MYSRSEYGYAGGYKPAEKACDTSVGFVTAGSPALERGGIEKIIDKAKRPRAVVAESERQVSGGAMRVFLDLGEETQKSILEIVGRSPIASS